MTLVTNDHQLVSAHKLVLSACSEVFSNIFNSNRSSNMMLYLDSVDVKEVNFMLDYIYQGEVNIPQEYLDKFLEIAVKFKLLGIVTDAKEEEVQETFNDIKENGYIYQDSNSEEYNHISYSEERKKNVKCMKERSLKTINQNFEANNAEIDQKFSELIEKVKGEPFRCTVCDKKMKDKRDMKRHLETHLSGLSYECSQCEKSFRSSDSLRQHKKNYCANL